MPHGKQQISFWKRSGLLEYMNIPHQNVDLFLSFCGIEQCVPGHFYNKLRSEYHLHVILSGQGTYIYNGQCHHLGRGDMFLILPKTAYIYTAGKTDPWRYAWIGFNGTKAKQFLHDAGFSSDRVIRKATAAPEQYAAYIQAMLECDPLNPADELKQLSSLYQYLSVLVSTNRRESSSKERPETYERMNYVSSAVRFMRENFTKPITVAQTASTLHIDVSYLYRLFQDTLQSSPSEFLMGLRMQHACDLLSSSGRSVQDIAIASGYKDASTFSKCFARENGMSPRAYRKNHAVS